MHQRQMAIMMAIVTRKNTVKMMSGTGSASPLMYLIRSTILTARSSSLGSTNSPFLGIQVSVN